MSYRDLGKYHSLVVYELSEEYSHGPVGSYELIYSCPQCEEQGLKTSDRKLYVNTQSLMFDCKRCGWRGRFDLVDDLHASTGTRTELAMKDFIESRSDSGRVSGSDQEDPVYYKLPSIIPVESDPAVNYLKSRGYTYDDVLKYNIRVASYDDSYRYQGRVVIPNRVISGKWTDMYVARSYDGREPKYLNPPNSPKNSTLYNLHRIPNNPNYLIIFEGVLEVITEGGYSVATYGKSLSSAQLSMIRKLNPSYVYLSWDNDAGSSVYDSTKRKVDEALQSLKSALPNSSIYHVLMPPGVDASDEGRELYHARLSSRCIEYISKSQYSLMLSSKLLIDKNNN